MKRQIRKNLFLLVQNILYMAFLTLDILEANIALSNYIKFTVVVLCFLYVLFAKGSSRQQKLLSYAMVFTVVSDVFLLLTNYYLYGLVTFILVQQLYGIRITELIGRRASGGGTFNGKKKPLDKFLVRIVVCVVITITLIIILWKFGVPVDGLLLASVFYFISIIINVARCIKLSIDFSAEKDIRYFSIGMLLFLLCDINVGLFNLSSFISMGSIYKNVYNISSVLMWAFYAPSQVMIALSGDEYHLAK
ncbi:MAG: hypothetical protein GX237_07095 [Clostridiales bacterium]|nr:hypothetical protein [Clostridiales bacterium]